MANHYETLGVSNTATQQEINNAFKKLALTLHPDKNPDADKEKFKEITAAYNVLKDVEARKKYDAELLDAKTAAKSQAAATPDPIATLLAELQKLYGKDCTIRITPVPTRAARWTDLGRAGVNCQKLADLFKEPHVITSTFKDANGEQQTAQVLAKNNMLYPATQPPTDEELQLIAKTAKASNSPTLKISCEDTPENRALQEHAADIFAKEGVALEVNWHKQPAITPPAAEGLDTSALEALTATASPAAAA